MRRSALFVSLSLFLLMTPIRAAPPTIIGYVDMQAVIDNSQSGRQARKALEERFEDEQRKLARKQQIIRQLQETLDRDQVLMNQKELDKKKAEIQEHKQEFQQRVVQLRKELSQEENKLTNRILEPVPTIIAELGKDKQIAAILGRRQSGLLYVDPDLDLTAEVIERLDAKSR